MNWIKKNVDIFLWGGGILFGVLVPVLALKLLPFTKAMWVGWVLVVINCCYCVWLGSYLYHHAARWWTLFVFPILFLAAAYVWMPKYTYYFAAAYLAITYLSCSTRKQD